MIDDPKDVAHIFATHLQNLFTSSNPLDASFVECLFPPMFQAGESDYLCTTPSLDEIKKVVFSLGPLKAPGMDGFNVGFIQKFWELVHPDVFRMVEEFFISDFIPSDMNHTLICLIPKMAKSSSAAFIPGRQIVDNILLAQEIFHFFKHTKVLSRLLSAYWDLDLFRGVRLSRSGPEISHLLFADDIFIFCRANQEDLLSIKAILDLFFDLSGQETNYAKSWMHFSKNVPVATRSFLSSVIGIKEMSRESLYLGTNLFHGKSKSRELETLISRMQGKLASWKTKSLSFAERGVLIKSVLASSPAFLMQCFRFPAQVCRKIDSICLQFWLGNCGARKKSSLISWDKMCRPKASGGLGFRKSEHHNQALLLKLGWRLITEPTSLWAKVLKAKYFPKTSFFDSQTKGFSSPGLIEAGWAYLFLVDGKFRFFNAGKLLVMDDLVSCIFAIRKGLDHTASIGLQIKEIWFSSHNFSAVVAKNLALDVCTDHHVSP
ncbi:uncharacterized protein LOC122667252 [Telopea speciosissima]|uniref:uncharacterized protein LOC122667252 n=1 Tax=Telopea speciosissima TaxID=54955 RepID=UPI001CC3D416|nr:uncharacterized protein LOC122667252 [Telopea speciosissima]